MPTISSSLVHPVVTPCTALFTSALVSPCSAALSSLARSRCRVPSTVFSVMPSAISAETLPLGPSTKTVLPSTLYFTPGGSGIGFFPMRDIDQNPYLGLRVPQERFRSAFHCSLKNSCQFEVLSSQLPMLNRRQNICELRTKNRELLLPNLAKQLAAHAFAARLAARHHAFRRSQNRNAQP